MATQTDRGITDRLPLKRGAVFGAVSFLVSYILTLIIVAAAEANDFTDDLVEAAGWIYYNAQLADVKISIPQSNDDAIPDIVFDRTINYVTDNQVSDGGFTLEMPSVVYHLIPLLSLVLFGFLLARYVGVQTTQDGALAGGTVILGSVPLTLIGVFLFSAEFDGVELSPVLLESILFVGVLFPLIFGAIGGAISAQLAHHFDRTEVNRR